MLRREQFQEVASYLESGAKNLRNKILIEDSTSSEVQPTREIPDDKPPALAVIIRLPKVRHRQMAVKWASGRFPPLSTTLLQEKIWRHLRNTPRHAALKLVKIPFR